MRKLLLIFMLFVFVSVGFAGSTGNAIQNPKAHELCYNADGKFDPQDKNCDENSCGCLFHEIGEFIKGLFE